MDVEVRELLGQNVVAVFVLGIDRNIRSVRTDKMPAGEVRAAVVGDKPAGAADLNFFIRRILGDHRRTGGWGRGSGGRRDRGRSRCGSCGNLSSGSGRRSGHRHGRRAAGRRCSYGRCADHERGTALGRVISEGHGIGKRRGIAADVGQVVGPGQVLSGDRETAGAAGGDQPVGLCARFARRLFHHHRIVVDDGLLLGIIGAGHLPVGALRGAAGPVDCDGSGLRILGRQTERAAVRKLLGVDAFEIHHVDRTLSHDGVRSDIRVVFVQKWNLRHAAGTEQHAADKAKHGKIQKSLFQNVQSSFYNKGILKGILPLAGVFYNYNPETIAYIVMFSVPFF